MATYSSNTTIKIDSKIIYNFNAAPTDFNPPVYYTVPANKYLDFCAEVGTGFSAIAYVKVDGVTAVSGDGTIFNVKAGPGAVIEMRCSGGGGGGGGASLNLHGVLFSNTP